MEKIRELAFTFACVTTGSLISAAIFISLFMEQSNLTTNILWQILFTSALCCLGNFLYPKRKISKRQLYFLTILHYVFVNVVVLGAGLYYEWFYFYHLQMVLVMVISIAIIFLVISFISYKRSQKESNRMNAKLQEYKKTHHINS